jgi:hypothetical protein
VAAEPDRSGPVEPLNAAWLQQVPPAWLLPATLTLLPPQQKPRAGSHWEPMLPKLRQAGGGTAHRPLTHFTCKRKQPMTGTCQGKVPPAVL